MQWWSGISGSALNAIGKADFGMGMLRVRVVSVVLLCAFNRHCTCSESSLPICLSSLLQGIAPLSNFGYLRYFLLLCVFYMFTFAWYGYGHMCCNVCGGQRTTCGNRFSLFTMWVLGMEFKPLGLVASTFTHCAISLATHQVSERLLSLSNLADLVNIVYWNFLELRKSVYK